MQSDKNTKKKQLNRLNKMLDLADKTGSTSDMANVNDDTQYVNETTTHSIVHTPMENQRVLSDINEKSIQEDEEPTPSFYSNSLGKKMINVTKENQIKPPMRNRNRPISTDASSLGSELSKMLSNGSQPSSPSKNRRLPTSPRKFDLQKEKNEIKRQSLDDVQDKLSEQLEELKSIASGNEPVGEHGLMFEKPNQVEYQGSILESTESLDKYYSAANSIDETNQDNLVGTYAQNIGISKPTNTLVKKISVPNFTQTDTMIENSFIDSYKDEDVTETNNIEEEEDDEYEDVVSEKHSLSSSKEMKKSIRRQLNSKPQPHNFNLNTMESLVGSMTQVNDFDNLGMKEEEKKYLQLLVNNLSKLTADMILDPSKYEEGIRRLKKAALALEGF